MWEFVPHSLYLVSQQYSISLSHTHTRARAHLLKTHISDSYLNFSRVTSSVVFPPGLMFLSDKSEWDLSSFWTCLSFSMPSSKLYKELKLLQYCKPTISPQARLKILMQTNNRITLRRSSLQTAVPKGLMIHLLDIRRLISFVLYKSSWKKGKWFAVKHGWLPFSSPYHHHYSLRLWCSFKCFICLHNVTCPLMFPFTCSRSDLRTFTAQAN